MQVTPKYITFYSGCIFIISLNSCGSIWTGGGGREASG